MSFFAEMEKVSEEDAATIRDIVNVVPAPDQDRLDRRVGDQRIIASEGLLRGKFIRIIENWKF